MARCNICSQDTATLYVVDVSGGVKREFFLCEPCASKLDIVNFAFPLVDNQSEIRCGSCGLTLSEFIKTKRLGCRNDYDIFGLAPILEQYHGSSTHMGKIPTGIRRAIDRDHLTDAIKAAISKEDYEEAARLRDLLSGMGDI